MDVSVELSSPEVAANETRILTEDAGFRADEPRWLENLWVLWRQRARLLRIACISFVVSLAIALVTPKMYEARARIMPPEMSDSGSALLASLAGRAFGSDALGGLAATLLGGRTNGALFVDLMQSTSVTDPLIERFELQHVYFKRYRIDAAKVLARRTTIVQDKKSGVITLLVRDRDPRRARDLAAAYLDQLNLLVMRTSTSPAHQERLFIEKRLGEVRGNLNNAQEALSEFSSTHSTIDLKEQALATVESQAKVEGELIAAQSELQSLNQLYGDSNIRVREAQARISSLKSELGKLGGSAEPLSEAGASGESRAVNQDVSYLPLRQVPRLAIPYANLYRDFHVQETVYDLLVQQYELARIQEAKDIPIVNIIDAPQIPEKKSFPPRTVLTLVLTAVFMVLASTVLISRHHWELINRDDSRRQLGREVFETIGSLWRSFTKTTAGSR